jgi:hypothetical protein
VNRLFPLLTLGEPQSLEKQIAADLAAWGYEVRDRPAICSPLSKFAGHHG